MVRVSLSDIELYYSAENNRDGEVVSLIGEEFHHAVKVMRSKTGDKLHITDGCGYIHTTEILSIEKNKLSAKILESNFHAEKFKNIRVFIPRLRNEERLEFAIEKSVELGFTKIVVFNSERTVRKNAKTERWNKIALSAMKQSLNAHLPRISFTESPRRLDDNVILFDQSGGSGADTLKIGNRNSGIYFGPEGGLTPEEIGIINPEQIIRLTDKRLRSETAIVTALALIALKLKD